MLMHALSNPKCHQNIIKLLLEKHADMNSCNKFFNTVIDIANELIYEKKEKLNSNIQQYQNAKIILKHYENITCTTKMNEYFTKSDLDDLPMLMNNMTSSEHNLENDLSVLLNNEENLEDIPDILQSEIEPLGDYIPL